MDNENQQLRTQELAQATSLVQQRISAACIQSGRQQESVKLIWVSKMHPLSDVEAAIAAGATAFGENKVQEALEKFANSRPGIELHIIGPVQSNKWRKAAHVAQWIHSADSIAALQKYEEVCAEQSKHLQVLIQVNTSGEASKSGLDMANAKSFLEHLPNLPHLTYRGLMTIGIHTGVAEDSRAGFAWLRKLRDEFLARGGIYANFTELSMGMTDDLEVAITEGSTLVRVGTAIFGARHYPA